MERPAASAAPEVRGHSFPAFGRQQSGSPFATSKANSGTLSPSQTPQPETPPSRSDSSVRYAPTRHRQQLKSADTVDAHSLSEITSVGGEKTIIRRYSRPIPWYRSHKGTKAQKHKDAIKFSLCFCALCAIVAKLFGHADEVGEGVGAASFSMTWRRWSLTGDFARA
jgi:hypothetical protein